MANNFPCVEDNTVPMIQLNEIQQNKNVLFGNFTSGLSKKKKSMRASGKCC